MSEQPSFSSYYHGERIDEKRHYEKTKEKSQSVGESFDSAFPALYSDPLANYFIGTVTGYRTYKSQCLDYLKAYIRCFSVNRPDCVNKTCFEEYEDLEECQWQHKSKRRYNKIREEYKKQTGVDYNPDAERLPRHVLYGLHHKRFGSMSY